MPTALEFVTIDQERASRISYNTTTNVWTGINGNKFQEYKNLWERVRVAAQTPENFINFINNPPPKARVPAALLANQAMLNQEQGLTITQDAYVQRVYNETHNN